MGEARARCPGSLILMKTYPPLFFGRAGRGLGILAASLINLVWPHPAEGAGTPKIGVFPTISDVRSKAQVDVYEAWLGRPVDVIIQGAPGEQWSNITNINWWIGQWAGHPAIYRDRIVLAINMLPKDDASATLALGATGLYNPYWRDVAEKLVAGGYGSITLRIGHEMNGNWYRWSAIGKAADYRNYWIQIVNTMRAVPGAAFKFCFNPGAGSTGMNPMDAFPGAGYVDLIGLDIYDTSWYYNVPGYPDSLPASEVTRARNNAWITKKERENYNLDWWAARSRELGIPLCFPEVGLDTLPANTGGRDNPIFVEEFSKWVNDPQNNVEWVAYFEWNGGTNSRNHALCFDDQYPQARLLYPQRFSITGKAVFRETFVDGDAAGWSGSPAFWSVVSEAGNPVYEGAFGWSAIDTSAAGGATWANYELEADVKITRMEPWSYTFLYGRYTDAANHYLLSLQKTDSATRLVLSKKVGGASTTLATVNTPLPLNTWMKVTLQMDGNRIVAKLNDAALIDVQDASHTAGRIALGTQKQGARFDNLTVKHLDPFLTENFEDSRAQGWTPTTPQWSFLTDGGDRAWVFTFDWAGQNGLATVGSYSWTDYEIATEFKVATPYWGWSETQVFARYRDAENFYLLKVQDTGGSRKLVLQKKVGGTVTTLGSANVTVNADTWYNISLQLKGSVLTAKLNGAQLLQVTDTSHAAGKSGLGAWKQTAAFDNVVID
jgi:hypothetical protein